MARKSYGVGYQGSKNRIAEKLMNVLPNGNRFVDLFSGGCAMTHCAMMSGKYNEYLCNDLYPHAQNLFQQAITTGFDDPKYLRWISREDFFKYKDSDDLVRCCWSFGNNQNNYMYGKNIEPFKKALHYACVYDDWSYFKYTTVADDVIQKLKDCVDGIPVLQMNERRLKMTQIVRYKERITTGSILQNIDRLNNVMSIDRWYIENIWILDRLKSIQQTDQNITFTSMDYRNYEHKEGDVVYCDPPYKGTGDYDNNTFDHDAFYEWVRSMDYPVYFSEYYAPDDFVSIFNTQLEKIMSGGKSAHNKATEHLFIHKKFLKIFSK